MLKKIIKNHIRHREVSNGASIIIIGTLNVIKANNLEIFFIAPKKKKKIYKKLFKVSAENNNDALNYNNKKTGISQYETNLHRTKHCEKKALLHWPTKIMNRTLHKLTSLNKWQSICPFGVDDIYILVSIMSWLPKQRST